MGAPLDITPHGIEKAIFLIVWAIGLGIFAYEAYFYIRLLTMFSSEKRWDKIGERISRLFKYVLGQRRLLDQLVMGTAHFLIFWGFVFIGFGTINFFGKGVSENFSMPSTRATSAWPEATAI